MSLEMKFKVLNPFMLVAQKSPDYLGDISLAKGIFGKYLEEKY